MIKNKKTLLDPSTYERLEFDERMTQEEYLQVLNNNVYKKHHIKYELLKLVELNPNDPLFRFYYVVHLFLNLNYIQSSILEVFKLKNFQLSLTMQ